MSDPGYERVEQHGEAFLVHGGHNGEKTSYWVTGQTVADARREGGEKAVEALFRSGIETSLASDREGRENR